MVFFKLIFLDFCCALSDHFLYETYTVHNTYTDYIYIEYKDMNNAICVHCINTFVVQGMGQGDMF